jgi:hypothetical protein
MLSPAARALIELLAAEVANELLQERAPIEAARPPVSPAPKHLPEGA